MKTIAYIAMVIGAISLTVGIISRFTVTPVAIGLAGLEAHAFLNFTNTCLLVAITFLLLHMLKSKQ